MRTIKEVSTLTGISIRTLRYYDAIGLLKPAGHTEGGYRLYDDAALAKLQQILLFRELRFPLKEIRRIMDSPDYDRETALEQQIALLTLEKERLEELIRFAQGMTERKENEMNQTDFSAFDTKKIDAYAAQAREKWGATESYREYAQKAQGRTREEEQALGGEMMAYFTALGALRGGDPAGDEAQRLVEELRRFITAHYYDCTKPILRGLGRMYKAGGEFTENIDAVGGPGTAAFAAEAIEAYTQIAART